MPCRVDLYTKQVALRFHGAAPQNDQQSLCICRPLVERHALLLLAAKLRPPPHPALPRRGRNCIGTGFAMIEAVLVVAALLQRYELRPPPNGAFPRPKALLTLRPDAVPLTVARRA